MKEIKKRVYRFGAKKAEGNGKMRELLGGKGANLAEMNLLGMPVPAGFTITTECCTEYYRLGGGYTPELRAEVQAALEATEKIMGKKFGDAKDPLLVSCRSGARSSMPGMMDTILNIGLCSKTIPGLIEKTKNPRFVYDAYRRLIMMYSDVVMEKAEGIEPADGQGIRQQLDRMMQDVKDAKGYKSDTDLTAEELKDLAEAFKVRIKEVLGVEFPDDAKAQLWGSIGGVFKSWNGKRAIRYRQIEHIPDDWGTAVNVQSMVFGNMGDTSATGVAFSRNPANGDNKFYGEWLINAQGEDVVAGIRTPNPLNEAAKSEKNKDLASLETAMPEVYKELDVHSRAPVVRNVLDLAVPDGALAVPGLEDAADGPPQLGLRIVREFHAQDFLDPHLEGLGEVLQFVGGELGVALVTLLVLDVLHHAVQLLADALAVGRLDALGLLHDDVGVHHDEAAVGVIDETRVLGLLDEARDGLGAQADVQDGVHHARHGGTGAGAAAHEEGILRVAELLAHDLLRGLEGGRDLGPQFGRVAATQAVVFRAALGRDGETGRDGHPEKVHFGEVRTLATEELTHFAVTFGLLGTEAIDSLFDLFHGWLYFS